MQIPRLLLWTYGKDVGVTIVKLRYGLSTLLGMVVDNTLTVSNAAWTWSNQIRRRPKRMERCARATSHKASQSVSRSARSATLRISSSVQLFRCIGPCTAPLITTTTLDSFDATLSFHHSSTCLATRPLFRKLTTTSGSSSISPNHHHAYFHHSGRKPPFAPCSVFSWTTSSKASPQRCWSLSISTRLPSRRRSLTIQNCCLPHPKTATPGRHRLPFLFTPPHSPRGPPPHHQPP